jgi:N utilization substance protein B
MQRKIARENAFLLVFEKSFKNDETAEEIFMKATTERGLEYDDYVKRVFFGLAENAEVIEQEIEKHLMGWKKDRVSPVSISILRLAAYEVMFIEDIPARVSLNEAIELAKKYDTDEAPAFVNGILNSVARSLGDSQK